MKLTPLPVHRLHQEIDGIRDRDDQRGRVRITERAAETALQTDLDADAPPGSS